MMEYAPIHEPLGGIPFMKSMVKSLCVAAVMAPMAACVPPPASQSHSFALQIGTDAFAACDSHPNFIPWADCLVVAVKTSPLFPGDRDRDLLERYVAQLASIRDRFARGKIKAATVARAEADEAWAEAVRAIGSRNAALDRPVVHGAPAAGYSGHSTGHPAGGATTPQGVHNAGGSLSNAGGSLSNAGSSANKGSQVQKTGATSQGSQKAPSSGTSTQQKSPSSGTSSHQAPPNSSAKPSNSTTQKKPNQP